MVEPTNSDVQPPAPAAPAADTPSPESAATPAANGAADGETSPLNQILGPAPDTPDADSADDSADDGAAEAPAEAPVDETPAADAADSTDGEAADSGDPEPVDDSTDDEGSAAADDAETPEAATEETDTTDDDNDGEAEDSDNKDDKAKSSDNSKPKKKSRSRPKRGKPQKDAYFVLVPSPDDTPEWVNATNAIGRPDGLPFKKPKMTLAMRVWPKVVGFSLLQLTKRSSKALKDQRLIMPDGPLARLQRHALANLDMPKGILRVEVDNDWYDYKMERDDVGVVRLEPVSEDGDLDEERVFELERGSVRLSMLFQAPDLPRLLAVSGILYLGRPGAPETVRRGAAKALNNINRLPEFHMLSQIEDVDVPALPGNAWTEVNRVDEDVTFDLRTELFDEDFNPVGAGNVTVTVDLEHANATTGQLLYHIDTGDLDDDTFAEYKTICERALNDVMVDKLGAEHLKNITYEIILGEVDTSTADRITDATDNLPNLQLTPSRYRTVDPAADNGNGDGDGS